MSSKITQTEFSVTYTIVWEQAKRPTELWSDLARIVAALFSGSGTAPCKQHQARLYGRSHKSCVSTSVCVNIVLQMTVARNRQVIFETNIFRN